MVPMHYGTFRLGREPMEEPVQRLNADTRRLALEQRVRVLGEGETMRLRADRSLAVLADLDPKDFEAGGNLASERKEHAPVSAESSSRVPASYEHG